MTDVNPVPSPGGSVIQRVADDIVSPFRDLRSAPRALWGVHLSYTLEGLTYFGVVGLLAIFFNEYIQLDDISAGQMVGFQTAGITLAMLFLGATVDIIGVRRALLISLLVMLVGRVILTVSPGAGGTGLWSPAHLTAALGLVGIILGYGIYQPACYAAVKFFSTEKSAAMGYAMLYALMNLGGFLPGLISPPVRHEFGITGVFWVYVALTVVGMIVIAVFINARTDAEARATAGRTTASASPEPARERKSLNEHIRYYAKNFPIRDWRFLFFIFILIPVQTLFAHNWLTLPQYCNRAFTGIVSENYEFFVNFSPLLIFLLAPFAAALTSSKNTYTMMIIGTAVMALPTFLLSAGPTIGTLFAYLTVMTIGEAIWSPRFLQWIAEVAPPGMTGIYMGIGQFPWFLTKVVTSLYSGWFLSTYCPAGVPPEALQTETMWFIYGLIALVTPIGLVLARPWMIKGFKSGTPESTKQGV
ncbi:MAG: major facilitator superfamily 1 [Bacteroidetes bacterium]|nr:major facilitator superfamily 1 [Bacteroidota bacterium]